MAKTSSQLKNMIEDYVKIVGSEMKDTTTEIQQTNSNVEWQILVGKSLHVTKMKNRNDRIDLLISIKFEKKITDQLITGTANVQKTLREINELLITNGFQYIWKSVEGKVTGLEIKTYIDEEELSRVKFFNKWDAIVNLSTATTNKILALVNPNLIQSDSTSDTTDSSMYQ